MPAADDPAARSLDRFLAAQAPAWATVVAELAAGEKRSHWIWFVFPQHRSLGRSATARFYGLADLDEARRYARHPQLGARLRECVRLVLGHPKRTATEMLGPPDDLKLRSCLTLFEAATDGAEPLFGAAIDRLYGGERDAPTLAAIGVSARAPDGPGARR